MYGTVNKGDLISLDNVAIKAPGVDGLEPYLLDNIIGKRYNKDMIDEQPITLNDVGD